MPLGSEVSEDAMQSGSCRRPNLGDAMILIVAAALAMAITKQVDARPPFVLIKNVIVSAFGSDAMVASLWIAKWISPWLLTMAVALLVIRFRQPRPRLRRIWHQPGTLASTLGILALIFVGLISLALPALHIFILLLGGFSGSNTNPPMELASFLAEVTSYSGTLILGSWLTLALSGRFRSEPGWIDGLGIIVGFCWITAHLISWVCYRIFL
jgi:hypothetical protein